MNREDLVKRTACRIFELGYRVQPMLNDLLKNAESIITEANEVQCEMNVLREQKEELIKALKRISEGILIVKPTGTIFMDDKEEQTLHAFIEETLKTWGG